MIQFLKWECYVGSEAYTPIKEDWPVVLQCLKLYATLKSLITKVLEYKAEDMHKNKTIFLL